MMFPKLFQRFLVVTVLAAFLAGCGSSKTTEPDGAGVRNGSMSFAMDMAGLETSARKSKAPGATITGVTVTLSRSGLENIIRDLDVVDNVASGQVDNLEPGYWHVVADVFDGDIRVFQGESDVNVVAGLVAQCDILFDPVIEEPTQGSISFTVGMNPVPGYKRLNQTVSKVMASYYSDRLFVYDDMTGIIYYYDANTMNIVDQAVLPSPAQAVSLGMEDNYIYCGYPNGMIYKLEIYTKEFRAVGDAMMNVGQIVPFSNNYLLIGSSEPDYSYGSTLKTMSGITGQVIDTMESWNALANIELNVQDNTAYCQDLWVSPLDLFRIRLDAADGSILSMTDSPYHGDYELGTPIRFINNSSRVITSSGNMFTTSAVDTEDLNYSGNLGYSYIDLANDDLHGRIYLLSGSGMAKLLVFDQGTLFVNSSRDVKETPRFIYTTWGNIVVVVEKDGKLYCKRWNKFDLI
jgi:hypothetical protein